MSVNFEILSKPVHSQDLLAKLRRLSERLKELLKSERSGRYPLDSSTLLREVRIRLLRGMTGLDDGISIRR
jgi:hypothetical protein